MLCIIKTNRHTSLLDYYMVIRFLKTSMHAVLSLTSNLHRIPLNNITHNAMYLQASTHLRASRASCSPLYHVATIDRTIVWFIISWRLCFIWCQEMIKHLLLICVSAGACNIGARFWTWYEETSRLQECAHWSVFDTMECIPINVM